MVKLNEFSLKSEQERILLKQKIFDEKLHIRYIKRELQLMATDSKTRVREAVYALLVKYANELNDRLQMDFRKEFSSHNGNLSVMTKKYEQWLKGNLSTEFKRTLNLEQSSINEILSSINMHFGFYITSFQDRLNENIKRTLKLELATLDWKPEYRELEKPSVSIYRSFDTPIDLLWFLFPMFLFKGIFLKSFSIQIPKEIQKNLYRLTSSITEIINKETEIIKIRILDYLNGELETVQGILSVSKMQSKECQDVVGKLESKILSVQTRPQSFGNL